MITPSCIALSAVVAAAVAWAKADPKLGFVWLLGCAIGWVLVHHRFGFSGAFRRLLEDRDPRAFYPLILLLTLLLVGSSVLLILQEPFGLPLRLLKAPLNLTNGGGAFFFGVGMVMAGRCGSGTLVSASRPNAAFTLTLLGLVAGVFTASLARPWLENISPLGLPPVQLLKIFPLPAAFALQLGLVGLLVLGVWAWSRKDLRLPWGAEPKLVQGALGLAGLALAVFVVTGEPWKVLWGFALTGAHLAHAAGWTPESSEFWATPARSALLSSPSQWWQHDAVVIDLGVIAGAWITGWLATKNKTKERSQEAFALQALDGRPIAAPPAKPWPFLAGGLLMGFGGFLAYGCNVSGFLGGVMSFSLHGWLWLLAALAGAASWIQLERKLRPE